MQRNQWRLPMPNSWIALPMPYGKSHESHYKIKNEFFPSAWKKKQYMVWSLPLIFLSTVLPLKAFLKPVKFTGLPYLIQREGKLKLMCCIGTKWKKLILKMTAKRPCWNVYSQAVSHFLGKHSNWFLMEMYSWGAVSDKKELSSGSADSSRGLPPAHYRSATPDGFTGLNVL